ncbi:hypothetical protein DW886_16780 [Enterocloster aldenensis]|uniref:hypothetical protein n=1 Tax=Enterocloster aldenensis TaxID=358742 RepID=UPI000E4EE164|nr:hypothetical protein DW886_16780 [Enterocloster aldenensis]
MKHKLTRKQMIELKQFCPNLKIGGSCWARCPYRENGRCELNSDDVLALAIKYLAEEGKEDESELAPIDVNVNYSINGKTITQDTDVEVNGYCRNISSTVKVRGNIEFMSSEKFTICENGPGNKSYDFYLEDVPMVRVI